MVVIRQLYSEEIVALWLKVERLLDNHTLPPAGPFFSTFRVWSREQIAKKLREKLKSNGLELM